tara:strand:+ start:1110 stop:1286 length:177 start_codon:yes stop_codon:yes gene_type:complete
MLTLIVPGLLGFALGVVLLLPPMQRRAVERGVSFPLAFPLVVCAIGFAAFVTGILFNG